MAVGPPGPGWRLHVCGARLDRIDPSGALDTQTTLAACGTVGRGGAAIGARHPATSRSAIAINTHRTTVSITRRGGPTPGAARREVLRDPSQLEALEKEYQKAQAQLIAAEGQLGRTFMPKTAFTDGDTKFDGPTFLKRTRAKAQAAARVEELSGLLSVLRPALA